MKRPLIALLVASCAAACSYGMTVEKLRHTSSPGGAIARVTTTSAQFTGELIEVQDAGLLILTSSRRNDRTQVQERLLRLVPFGAIESSAFEQLRRGYRVARRRAPDAANRERLRLVSRFPYGLRPELLAQLLASLGQKAVAGVQP